MKTEPVVLRFSYLWLVVFGVAGAALGGGIGFALPVVGRWMVDLLGEVPGPVEVAMTVPPVWLVPILTVVGIIGGAVIFEIARGESLALTVDTDHVELSRDGRDKYVAREHVASVFREDADLVLIDRDRRPLARFKADDLRGRDIARAFRAHGYPWLDDNDPMAGEYIRWIDGRPETGADLDAVLRGRRRAMDDDDRTAIEEFDEKLLALGIDVRDRKGEQQIRLLSEDRGDVGGR
ncbi:YqeB family protein [Nocardia cyriacigeorgica]|uniref:YqeB family protein n=1 Tax=Nocardia cyriacigeorgica TaxID=135487 RepID=UPI00245500D8|nr:hypothetical protein [Nocardia cyriacigeorgica]